MTNEEIIDGLQFTIDMCEFDLFDGDKKPRELMSKETLTTIHACEGAIEALKAQPCEDAVSRESVLEVVNNPLNIKLDKIIEKLPPVTPKPRTGKWTNQRVIYANGTIDFKVCSECRYEFSYDAETGIQDANYCPNCGAKMEGESE